MAIPIRKFSRYYLEQGVLFNRRTKKRLEVDEKNRYRLYNDKGVRVSITHEEVYLRSESTIDCNRTRVGFTGNEVDARGVLWSAEFPSQKIEESYDNEGLVEWCRCNYPEIQFMSNPKDIFIKEGMTRLSKNQIRLINPSIHNPSYIVSFSNMYIRSTTFFNYPNHEYSFCHVQSCHRLEEKMMVPNNIFTNNMVTDVEVKHFLVPIRGMQYWIPESKMSLSLNDMFELLDYVDNA